MKRLLMTSAALAVAASGAMAGSMSGDSIDWNGLYAGGNVTFGQADMNAKGMLKDIAITNGVDEVMSKSDGLGGAVRVGYDVKIDKFVIGVAADYNFGTYDGAWSPGASDIMFGQAIHVDVRENTALFARAGYSMDNFTPYALVGYKWADGKLNVAGNESSFNLDGATYGLGVERQLTENITAYGEWSYTDFGGVMKDEIDSLSVTMNEFKIGMNYGF